MGIAEDRTKKCDWHLDRDDRMDIPGFGSTYSGIECNSAHNESSEILEIKTIHRRSTLSLRNHGLGENSG